MAGLFSKARTLVLSNLHTLLDKAIDLNSVEAVKQHVRDLEEALEGLQDSSAQAAGNVRTVQRELQALEVEAKTLDDCIETLVSDDDPSNDNQALPLQARLDAMQPRLTAKREELVAAQRTAAELSEAASALQAKHATMVEQVNTLETMERTAKAKTAAATAIGEAGRLIGGTDSVSVDDVAAQIRKNADVADVKFERAMQGLGSATGKDAALAQAAAGLAARKAKLAAAKAVAQPTPAASPAAEPVQATA